MYKKIKLILFFFSLIFFSSHLFANDKKYINATDLIRSSNSALKIVASNENLKFFKQYLRNAKAVLIFPQLIEGGFFFGAKGGNGVLMIKKGKSWTGPFFYTMGGISLGLQLGVKTGELVMTVMSYRGLESILKERLKFGVDIESAIATEGMGLSADSTVRLADVYTFSNNAGLFIGGSFDGSYIQPRNDFNLALFKKEFSSEQILNSQELHQSAQNIINTLEEITD
ncbi:MAG: hypothetical protein CMM91_03190 [Rickettsiales bacterium]|nr:hypothetical protein [Rickettsiales bacterium]OUV54064.1 MAG: hypothetical protein CBC87_01935 [Rickettsiales bacterium TMED127]|tara:strand:+ start:4628 stop:5308 length:681 start_codon:yes stop_codon:yes gene_type:complete